jgi:hypothetical protein
LFTLKASKMALFTTATMKVMIASYGAQGLVRGKGEFCKLYFTLLHFTSQCAKMNCKT